MCALLRNEPKAVNFPSIFNHCTQPLPSVCTFEIPCAASCPLCSAHHRSVSAAGLSRLPAAGDDLHVLHSGRNSPVARPEDADFLLVRQHGAQWRSAVRRVLADSRGAAQSGIAQVARRNATRAIAMSWLIVTYSIIFVIFRSNCRTRQ